MTPALLNAAPPPLTQPSTVGPSRWREAVLLVTVVAVTLAWYGVVEWVKPGYFLWDDNAAYYLPCYVYNHHALVGEGQLPHVNFHQYLGHIYLGSGQSAVLYPPVYLAVGLARAVWGDPLHAIDLLALLHLAAAAAGMVLLLRHLGVGRPSAALTALLWVTLPFLPQVSRSWIFISYVAALLPFNLLCLERLLAAPSARRVLALAAVKALLFYQGYVQYAVLVALFDGLYTLTRWAWDRELRAGWRRVAAYYLGALAATGALAAPLLVPMVQVRALSAYRASALSYPEFISNALPVAPFAWAQVFVMKAHAIHLASGAIFYVGLPVLAALAVLLLTPLRRRPGAAPFVSAAVVSLVALVFATRAHGLFYGVPLMSSFRWPFKYFLLFLFFAAVATGGCGALLQRITGWWRWLAPALLAAALASHGVIGLQRTWDRPFGPNRLDQPIAALEAEIDAMLPDTPGRVVSLWMKPLHPRIERLLVFNYATLVGAYHLGGYDPLIAAENLELALNLEFSNIFRNRLSPELLAYLSAWGVRYFTVPERPAFQRALGAFPQLVRRFQAGGIEVWENRGAQPIAHFQRAASTALPFTWGINDLRIATSGQGGVLQVALAPLPWYVWSADGVEQGAVTYDQRRQMQLAVPPGTQVVVVRYVDVPFRLGSGICAAFVLSVLGCWLLRARRQHGSPALIDRA